MTEFDLADAMVDWEDARAEAASTGTTFRDMTLEHLGDSATPQDLAIFQSACLILQEEQDDLTDGQATALVWNGGDWLPAACDIVGGKTWPYGRR